MGHRTFVAAILAIGAFGAVGASCSRKPLAAPKHVLLIVIDTQRADHLSCYGYARPTSPAIDTLAKEGVVFERAVSQASWTLPSMVSMMTSAYLADEILAIPDDQPTLAEQFQSRGFATGAFICNNVLSRESRFDRGFDTFLWELVPYGPNRPILEWIRAHAAGPTFTFVHLNEVHDDVGRADHSNYGPDPVAQKGRYRREPGALTPGRLRYFDEVSERLRLQGKEESVAKIGAEIGGYDDDVVYSDARIREILEEYKKLGLWDSTAVVIAADHGEGLWTREQFLEGTRKTAMERGEAPTLVNTLQMTHGSQAAIELVHVPIVLKAPGIPQARVGAWVENLDIGPTLLALCRIDAPPSMQGRSLVELARDPDTEEGLAEGVFSYTRYHTSVISQEGIQLLQPTPRGECEFGLGFELYDLPRDPEARKNLAGDRREIAALLMDLGAKRLKAGIRGGSAKIGPVTMAALAGLGYIDSGVVDVLAAELEATSTDELLKRLEKSHDCLLRLHVVRALKGRDLGEEQRAAVRGILEKETSAAMQEALRGLLPAARPGG